MDKLAKKFVALFPWRASRQALGLVCLASFLWSAGPAKAVAFPSLSSLNAGQTLTANLNYQGAASLAAEPVVLGPEQPPTIKQYLYEICVSRGYGEDCAKTLLGMAWKESLFDGQAVGDGGRAHGFFQIHYRLHGVTLECARNLKCSAEWTLDYLERNGYPEYPNYATQCHNGCNVANGYAASVRRHGSRLWNAEKDVLVAVK